MHLNIPVERTAGLKFAILYTVLLVAAFVFMLINMVAFHYYAKYESGFPFSSRWVIDSPDRKMYTIAENATGPPSTPLPYCFNRRYDWPLTPELIAIEGPAFTNVSNIGCLSLPSSEFVSFAGDEVRVGTFMYETTTVGNQSVTKHYFITEAEKTIMVMNHGVYIKSYGTTSLPETTVVNEAGTVIMKTKAGQFPQIPLDVLSNGMTGGDSPFLLDTWRDDFPFPPDPFRMTGVYLLLDMKYENLFAWSTSTEVKCTITAKYLPNVWGVLSTQGARHIHGYRIIIRTSSSIGKFDFMTTLTYFLSSVVLFGVAEMIAVQVFMITKKWIKHFSSSSGEEDPEKNPDEEGAAAPAEDAAATHTTPAQHRGETKIVYMDVADEGGLQGSLEVTESTVVRTSSGTTIDY